MTLTPSNPDELQAMLAQAHRNRQPIAGVQLDAFNQILQHTPEDLTVTTQTGISLASLQESLAPARQWLPLDPPLPDRRSIADLVHHNLSGPRRFGYGTVREHLIGIKVVLADGRLISAGGQVVKNVAGYDLCKLFVGSQGTLGIVVEATFKLWPQPESEIILATPPLPLPQAAQTISLTLASQLTPAILDLHNLADPAAPGSWQVVIGFSGTLDETAWSQNSARELGFHLPSRLDYEEIFWSQSESQPNRCSVAPAKLLDTLAQLGPVPCISRAGNGAVYYRNGTHPAPAALPRPLLHRIKDEYDPTGILPPLPW